MPGQTEKKTKKKRSQPSTPKAPNLYALFTKEWFANHPGSGRTKETMLTLSEEWKNVSPELRQRLTEEQARLQAELDAGIETNKSPKKKKKKTNVESVSQKKASSHAPWVLSDVPIARVRRVLGVDAENKISSKEVLHTVAKATELFVKWFSEQAALVADSHHHGKLVRRQDVEDALETSERLRFLQATWNPKR